MKCLLIVLGVLLVLALLAFIIIKLVLHFTKTTQRLPLHLLGLENIPAVPLQIDQTIETLLRLARRSTATRPVQFGYSNRYTIDGHNATGYQFLYGKDEIKFDAATRKELSTDLYWTAAKMIFLTKNGALATTLKRRLPQRNSPPQDQLIKDGVTYQSLFLDEPKQFSISWSQYYNIDEEAQDKLEEWAGALTDVAIANRAFWPTIANYGLAYNLMVLEKVTPDQLPALQVEYGEDWSSQMTDWSKEGLLYAIDMTIYANLEVQEVADFPRFTPSTYTLLKQDPVTKDLTPVGIWVAGYEGTDRVFYSPETATAGAWLYALQAAKVSVTVYGIWSGHVYHWHIVTASMQMYLYENFEQEHVIYQLLQPISNYLISFDDALLLLWGGIAPPTSMSTAKIYLEFTNSYAEGRNFFDDDPINTLKSQGIQQEHFTQDPQQPWDKFKLVGQSLEIWMATEKYIATFVAHSYASDQAVQQDEALQNWMAACSHSRKGNIKGLPKMATREALINVLTSFVYRITVHGTSRLIPVANPALSFVGNFPPCLQRTDRPAPDQALSTKELMTYLPNVGTIGEMMNFYNTFSFSAPYEPLLPLEGIERKLFFDNENPEDPRNKALMVFREDIRVFMDKYVGDGLIHQWPLNIET